MLFVEQFRMAATEIHQSSIHTGGNSPSTNASGTTVISHAHKSTVPPPYAQIHTPVAAGGKLLRNIRVSTENLPTLNQKHEELLKDEEQHTLLLQKERLTDGEVYELQRLATNIHRVYGQGMYDRTSLAVVRPDPVKAMQVLLDTIQCIDTGPKLDKNRILPELHYFLAKTMMSISKRLQANSRKSNDMQQAAMVYYNKSNTFPGSAFALFVHQFGGNLSDPEGRKQFQKEVANLPFPKEDKAYYAGKYFMELAEASKATDKHLCAIFRDLSTKYFKEAARRSASYRGEKANAYMAKHVMSGARDMHKKALNAGRDSDRKNFCKHALHKIQQACRLIFGSAGSRQVSPDKHLGAHSYAVLADAHAVDYALTGYDPIRMDALRYQEAANALGMPNNGVTVPATYHVDLMAGATPKLLAAIAPQMEGASSQVKQALTDRAVGDADQFEGVLLFLIEQGSEESLETIAATDNLPKNVMDALLTKINSKPGNFQQVKQALTDRAVGDADQFEGVLLFLIEQGSEESLETIAATDNLPKNVMDALLTKINSKPGNFQQVKQALTDRAVGDADRFERVLLFLIEQGSEESLETIAATDNLPKNVMDALLTKINSKPGNFQQVKQALTDRAVRDADQFEGVLLFLIEQGSEESLETTAATDNLPKNVMDALLTKINSKPGNFEKAAGRCVQQGYAEALLNTPPCDDPQAVVDRLAAYPPLIRDDLLLVVLAKSDEPWIMQQIPERNWMQNPAVENALIVKIQGDPERFSAAAQHLAQCSNSPDILEAIVNLGKAHPVLVEAQNNARHKLSEIFFAKESLRFKYDTGRTVISATELLTGMIGIFDKFSPLDLRNAIFYVAEVRTDPTGVLSEAQSTKVLEIERMLINALLQDDKFLQHIVYNNAKDKCMRNPGEIIDRIEQIQQIFITPNLGKEMYVSQNIPHPCNIQRLIGIRLFEGCQTPTSDECQKGVQALDAISTSLGLYNDLITWRTDLELAVKFFRTYSENRKLTYGESYKDLHTKPSTGSTTSPHTCLIAAIRQGNLQFSRCCVYLYKYQGILQMADSSSMTIFHHAAASSSVEFVQMLIDEDDLECLKEGDFLRTPDSSGNTALHCAALHRGSETGEQIVRAILDRFPLTHLPPNRHKRTALHCAAQGGHTATVECMVRSLLSSPKTDIPEYFAKCVVSDLDDSGKTPLHYAVEKNNLQMVECLVKNVLTTGHTSKTDIPEYFAKCVVSVLDASGKTPLHHAVEKNNLQMVECLVKNVLTTGHTSKMDIPGYFAECIVSVLDASGKTPLHHAVEKNNLQMVKYLVGNVLSVRKNIQEPDYHCKETALQLAVKGEFVDIIEYLVCNGANIYTPNEAGISALTSAVRASAVRVKNLEVLEKLFANGKQFELQHGQQALLVAVRSKEPKIFACLMDKGNIDVNCCLEKGYQKTILHFATESKKIHAVKWLIGNGANIDAVREDGKTPLHLAVTLAVRREFVDIELAEIIRYLVCNGANIYTEDYVRNSALTWTVQKGNPEGLEMLFANGKQFELQHGQQALLMAVQSGKPQVFECLMDKGNIDVNCRLKQAYQPTILHFAAESKKMHAVKWLVENGADINAVRGDGKTPLHLAVKEDVNTVRELLSLRAKVDAIDNSGETPLHLAVANQNLDVVKILIEAKANPSIQNDQGKTPLYYATESGSKELIAIFSSAPTRGDEVTSKPEIYMDPMAELSVSPMEFTNKLELESHLIKKFINDRFFENKTTELANMLLAKMPDNIHDFFETLQHDCVKWKVIITSNAREEGELREELRLEAVSDAKGLFIRNYVRQCDYAGFDMQQFATGFLNEFSCCYIFSYVDEREEFIQGHFNFDLDSEARAAIKAFKDDLITAELYTHFRKLAFCAAMSDATCQKRSIEVYGVNDQKLEYLVNKQPGQASVNSSPEKYTISTFGTSVDQLVVDPATPWVDQTRQCCRWILSHELFSDSQQSQGSKSKAGKMLAYILRKANFMAQFDTDPVGDLKQTMRNMVNPKQCLAMSTSSLNQYTRVFLVDTEAPQGDTD